MNQKYKVLVTRRLPSSIESRMKELFECTLNTDNHQMTAGEIREMIPGYDGLVSTITDPIDATVLDAGKSLRIVANFGVGVDHIDLKAAANNGIIVTNTPDTLTGDTADMAMAMILAVSRRVIEGSQMIRTKQWNGWSPTWMRGFRIHGKRLGIVGMGRIGRALARRAYGFGMFIHYHNRTRLDESRERVVEASHWSSLNDMLSHVDIVSLHCPYTDATHHLIDDKRLELMKNHSFLINTSRGEVVAQEALISALKEKKIAGAALDVFRDEPAVPDDLIAMPNVVCLPHMASATMESRIEMGEQVLINLRAVFDAHSPPNRVVDSN